MFVCICAFVQQQQQVHTLLSLTLCSQMCIMYVNISRDNELHEIVKLASRPMPDRPQGMVCVAIYTTSNWKDNKNNNMEPYVVLARNYPGSLFLMNSNINNSINNRLLLPSSASPSPTTKTTVIHVYAGGKRVAQIVENSLCGGNNEGVLSQLQHVLESQLQHAPLTFDLLAPTPSSSSLPTETIDAVAEEYDFESSYGNWLPNVED